MNAIEQIISSQRETTRIQCPYCSEERKKNYLKTMGVTVEHDRVVYQCFHCGVSGAVKKDRFMYQAKEIIKAPPPPVETPSEVKPLSLGTSPSLAR